MYLNVNNPVNYQLQGFGQNGVRTISTDQLYIQGEYYRVLVAEEDSYVTAVSVLGDDLTAEFVYAGTTIYGLFTEVSVSSGSLTAYIAGPTDIEDVWAYINAYGQTNAATIEAADCAKDAIAPLLDKYYAKASLVMVPSLYKTSIVYSERPLTTDGQLAFTRSNDTATRVGPDGLIEKVRTNLILQSETFSNASWGKTTATITADTTTAPNGTTTADTFDATSNFGFISQSPTLASGSLATYSVYIKNIDAPYVNLQIRTTVTAGLARFDFTGATLTGSTLTTGISANFTDVGSGWYRCTLTCTTSEANQQYRIQLPNSGDSVFVWGAMAEVGDVMTAYIGPTLGSAVSVGPVANVPRLDYLNSSCPRLLLEPQRTNLLQFSEQFDNAYYSKNDSTITANDGISPDGFQSADKVTLTTSAGRVQRSVTLTADTQFTLSVFVKDINATNSRVGILCFNNANTLCAGQFTLTGNGSIFSQTASVGSITPFGNGWYRCAITFNSQSGGTTPIVRVITNATGVGFTDGESVLIYGAQLEVGSYATSYIPTLGASVTRGADACSKTGISSLIGQTQGTMFLDVVAQVDTVESQDFSISDGTASNRASIRLNNSGLINAIGVFGGSVQFSMGTDTYVTGQRYKIALAYKLNDVVLYVNGVQSATDTSATISGTLSRLGFDVNTTGTQNLKSRVNQAILFKTRLTNQELQDLTTL